MDIKDIMKEIASLRREYGEDICTDVIRRGGIASYEFMPDDVTGYTVEIDLASGLRRTKGNGAACFWTAWV